MRNIGINLAHGFSRHHGGNCFRQLIKVRGGAKFYAAPLEHLNDELNVSVLVF